VNNTKSVSENEYVHNLATRNKQFLRFSTTSLKQWTTNVHLLVQYTTRGI